MKLPKPSKMKRREMGKAKRADAVNNARRIGRSDAIKKRQVSRPNLSAGSMNSPRRPGTWSQRRSVERRRKHKAKLGPQPCHVLQMDRTRRRNEVLVVRSDALRTPNVRSPAVRPQIRMLTGRSADMLAGRVLGSGCDRGHYSPRVAHPSLERRANSSVHSVL